MLDEPRHPCRVGLALFLVLFLALTALFLPASALAATITPGGDAIMQCDATLTGEIRDGDADKLRSFAKQNGWEPAFAGSGSTDGIRTLCLDSNGGSYLEGIELGNVIGSIGIRTAVGPDRTCESACALTFMYGTFRTFEDIILPERRLHPRGTLGFHAPGLVVPRGDYTEDAVNDAYRVAIQSVERLARMRGMGQSIFPQALFLTILGTPPEEMRYVRTVQEAATWNIEVFPVGFPTTDRHRAVLNACTNGSPNAGVLAVFNRRTGPNLDLIESAKWDAGELRVTTRDFFHVEAMSKCRLVQQNNAAQRSHLGKVEFLDVGVLSNSPLYRYFFFPPDMRIRDIPERPGMSDGQFFEALAGARPMPAPDAPRAEAPPPTATPAALIAPLATEADEARLNLDRAARQEIQRRLTLAGFDTGGVDGDLGPNSRRAIRDWQQARGFPVSGHLNASQRTRLIEDSRELYDAWLAEEQAKPRKRRVKVCQRGALGLLVNCRMEWR
jgi:hypothetical protein